MILNFNKYSTLFSKLLGLCDSENIINISAVPQKSFTSNVFLIKIQYITNSGKQDKTVFLKNSNINARNAYYDLCVNEIDFYKSIKKYPSIDVLPNCYYEEYNENTGQTVLILEDLSKDYFSIPIMDIKLEDILSCCSSLSKFHAAFWNNCDLNEKNSNYHKIVSESKKMIFTFFDNNSQLIPHKWIESINTAYEIYVELLTDEYYRKQKTNNITLLNGDAHISNFMFSKKPNKQPKLIDFQFQKIGISCLDLAHLTRKTTTVCKHKQDHECVVKRYYDSLIEYGIKDYTYEQCFCDYQRCVATLVLNPIWQYSKFNIPFDVCIQPMDSLIKNFKITNE